MKKTRLLVFKNNLFELITLLIAATILSACARSVDVKKSEKLDKPLPTVKQTVTQVTPKSQQDFKTYIPIPQQKASVENTKPAPQQEPMNSQLSRITELKKSLTIKIAEAEKARNEFVTEVTAINEQISKTGDKLPVKRLNRLKRDIKRKQSYVGLITEYHDKLADGFDTLDEIESEYNDRKRWRLLVEDTFIAKVDQAIRDITALINDSPVKTAKLDNTAPQKSKALKLKKKT